MANVPAHSANIYKMSRHLPSQGELIVAAASINMGKKVVILAGRGALDAREEILQLAAMTPGVIIKALLGRKAVVPDDNPRSYDGRHRTSW